MKVSIIGAGNMGGAIAKGIATEMDNKNITVCSPNRKGELDALKTQFADINVSKDNKDATSADIIFIAVKPWLLKQVANEIKDKLDLTHQTIVSIVAGVSCADIAEMFGDSENTKIIRVIPNTAISVGESMTFIAPNKNAENEAKIIYKLFDALGKSMIIEERLMGAGTALASCGIAYAMRYLRAATEGGVQLGFYADSAKEIVMQTMLGAVKLLEETKNNPEVEIDKVTTPGGITIKGLNAMEKSGFTAAVIDGLIASNK